VGVVCAVGLVLMGGAMVLGMVVGPAGIGFAELWRWVTGEGVSHTTGVILSCFRLPRVLVASGIGLALGVSGAAFQGMLRNPLAEPFILGISGGAAAGAVLALALGASSSVQTVGAMAGALATMAVVGILSRRGGRMEITTLVLTGVMVNAFFSAVIMVIISLSQAEQLHSILFWLYGELGGATMVQGAWMWAVALAGAGLIMALARELNLLASGEEVARALGVEVEWVKLVLFLAVGIMSAVSVCVGGIIGFVGLMMPHIARILLGPDHRLVVPAAGLGGGALLVAADVVARSGIAQVSLPVGVVTACVGAPFFLLLLLRRGSQWW